MKPPRSARRDSPLRGAFTLVELLVVLAVVALLMGMAMPMVSMAQERARRSQTQVVLRSVETALRTFRSDLGVYPYQADEPDLSAGGRVAGYANRLWTRLGTDLDIAGRTAVRTDLDTAAKLFDDDLPSPLKFTDADPAMGSSGRRVLLNRMARERTRLAVLSGNLAQEGPRFAGRDRSGDRVLNPLTAASRAQPGWCADYLGGELEPRFIERDSGSVLDAWKRPLVYINRTIPGMRGAYATIAGQRIGAFDARAFGLGPQGFPAVVGPATGLAAAGRLLLLYNGRVRISDHDAGDGLPTPTDATCFPDAASPLRSDARYYAAPGFESEFELWSAGGDGRFAWMRDDALNRDNLTATDVQRGLR